MLQSLTERSSLALASFVGSAWEKSTDHVLFLCSLYCIRGWAMLASQSCKIHMINYISKIIKSCHKNQIQKSSWLNLALLSLTQRVTVFPYKPNISPKYLCTIILCPGWTTNNINAECTRSNAIMKHRRHIDNYRLFSQSIVY